MSKEAVAGKFRVDLTANRRWLRENMNPYYFITMKDEPMANAMLERELGMLSCNRRMVRGVVAGQS